MDRDEEEFSYDDLQTFDPEVVQTYNPPPALTPEDVEDELISLAAGLAKQRLLDGTASNQLIAEVLKLGTAKERLQREKLRHENELLQAKTKAIESGERMIELYQNAVNAMTIYTGAERYVATEEDFE